MRSHHEYLLGAGLAALLLGPGPSARAERTGEEDLPPSPVAQQQRVAPSAATLTREVQDALDGDHALRGQSISANVSSSGRATLNGAVTTQAQKDHATDVASLVKGVSSVDNKLAVSSAGGAHPTATAKQAARETGQVISDDWITTKVKAQLVTTGSGIHVSTTNHVVTLSGTAASAADREKAVSIAKTTDGVTSVVDEIHVGPK